MPSTKKSQMSVAVSPEFYAVVEAHRISGDFKSWSAALLDLATIGYTATYAGAAPDANAGWGGDRLSVETMMKIADEVTNGGRNDPAENEG